MKEIKRAGRMKSNNFGSSVQTFLYQGLWAFTLAEMMVVLLILSIVLAAMAPIMTTRIKRDTSNALSGANSIWQWSQNNNGIAAYFGADANQTAMIGQTEVVSEDPPARLIINASDTRLNHILFKKGDDVLGRLSLFSNEILLGRNNTIAEGTNNFISLGNNTTVGNSSLTIGNGARAGVAGIAIGTSYTTDTDAIVAPYAGQEGIAIGIGAISLDTGGIALGKNVNSMTSSIIVGNNSYINKSTGRYKNYPKTGIILGHQASIEGAEYGIVIGNDAHIKMEEGKADGTRDEGAIAIGRSANVYNEALYADNYSEPYNHGAIAIGKEASARDYSAFFGNGGSGYGYALSSISIGVGAESNLGGIAIGPRVVYGTLSSKLSIDRKTSAANGGIAIGAAAYASKSGELPPYVFENLSQTELYLLGNTPVAIGVFASSNGDGVAIGNLARAYSSSVAIGNGVLKNSTVYGNTGIGSVALTNNTTGGYNTAIGYQSLYSNVSGSNNTAIGQGACLNVQGSNKTCIGANSGPATDHDWAKSTDSTERIFIGSKSKFNDAPAVLEVHNSDKMIPFSKYSGTTYGYPETAVVVNGTLIVKGGIYTTLPHMSGSSHVIQKDGANVSFIGSTVDANGIEKIHNSEIGEFYSYYNGYGGFYAASDINSRWESNRNSATNYSDRRLKYVGKEFTSGLDKIRQLKVFNYTFKKDEKKTPRVGVIAQDLQKIFPNAVKKGVDGFLTIRMEDMFYALVNAVKELDAKVTAMASDFAKQKEQLFSAQKDINALKKENKELKQALNKANNDNKKLEARLNALEAKLK